MPRKKWIALAIVLIFVGSISLGYLLVYGLVDYDGDGIQNLFDKYPDKNDFPVTSYASEKISSSNVVNKFSVLDNDLSLDHSEKEFIDYICKFDVDLLEEIVDSFLSDGKISSLELSQMHLLDTFTEYLSKFDINLQEKISKTFLVDGKISTEEFHQMNFLNSFPEANQIEWIKNEKFVDFDWDNDKMNNYFEKEIAQLPYEVYNGRYAILVDTYEPEYRSDMYQFLTNEQKFLPSNIYELISTNATIAKFKQSTEELAQKTNPDDIVIITFNGHGGDGRFCFNDGYGNNQKSNINMLYKEIDNCLDGIKSYVTVITVSACYSKTALEPLKEGTFPRVVITMDNCWFSSISKNYLNPAMAHLPKQYYYIKPEDYDINGNEYVSIKESWDTRHKCQQRYFSQHPEQENKDGLMDISNISSDLYLGDFSLYYSFIDVPESSYNPCPDRLFFLYDRYAITSPNGYVIPIEIRNYGSNSSIIDPSDILYNHKKANEYGAFAPETNYNNPITLGAFGNPEECIVIEITLKTGTDSPWHPEQDVSIHISDIVFLIGLPEI